MNDKEFAPGLFPLCPWRGAQWIFPRQAVLESEITSYKTYKGTRGEKTHCFPPPRKPHRDCKDYTFRVGKTASIHKTHLLINFGYGVSIFIGRICGWLKWK